MDINDFIIIGRKQQRSYLCNLRGLDPGELVKTGLLPAAKQVVSEVRS